MNLDKENAAGSIAMLPKQINQAWAEGYSIDFPESYKRAKNIVIAGMGGSAYGARIVKSLFNKTIKVPVDIANGYHLPGFANKDSLVFLCSYSGETEETLSCAFEAKEINAIISGITSGGQLGQLLKNYSSYIFTPKYNPGNQPRIGVGYMVTGLIAMLAKLEFIDIKTEDVISIVEFLEANGKSLKIKAKQLAQKMHQSIPVFIVADFLKGGAHAIRNPIHETGKQFGLYFTVPELNHHLMEGLAYPKEAKKYISFIFINSNLYEERNNKRMNLTQEVVEKNGIETFSVDLEGKTRFAQSMELIQFGGWFSFYLAMLNGIDPSPVLWVDYFKQKLSHRV